MKNIDVTRVGEVMSDGGLICPSIANSTSPTGNDKNSNHVFRAILKSGPNGVDYISLARRLSWKMTAETIRSSLQILMASRSVEELKTSDAQEKTAKHKVYRALVSQREELKDVPSSSSMRVDNDTYERQKTQPVSIQAGEGLWVYRNSIWRAELEEYASEDEIALQVKRYALNHETEVERARAEVGALEKILSGNTSEDVRKIPQPVKLLVWRRDQGQCGLCGSREQLEFDHIIPVAKGGSNTERNIQLLCARCNRSKSDRI